MHIYGRLREERERLGFTQAAFGAIGGVSVRAQNNYEKGDRAPDVNYLASVAKVGVDIQYIITGVRSASLMGEEAQLLEQFRKMDSETKRRTLAMVYGGTPPAAKQIFNGPVGQTVKGGITYEKEVKFEFNDKK